MKNKKLLMLLAVPALLLTACGPSNPSSEQQSNSDSTQVSTSSEDKPSSETPVQTFTVTFHLYDDVKNVVKVNGGERVPKPENPTREGYLFVDWYDAAEEGNPFHFGTKIIQNTDIYARWTKEGKPEVNMDMLQKALDADYSNCQTSYYTENEMGDGSMNHWVFNVDGFNVVSGMNGNLIDGQFSFFHDFEGKSYRYFEDKTHGGAWINKGLKLNDDLFVDHSMQNNYFKPDYVLPLLTANDFELQQGLFFLVNPEKIAAIRDTAFSYVQDNEIAEVAIQLDDSRQYVHKIYTYDSTDPKVQYCTVTEFGYIGTTEFTVGTLPPAPTKETVKTWYEWLNEPEPDFHKIQKIVLSFADETKNKTAIGQSIQLHYEFTPAVPDKKDIEFVVEGENPEGLEIKYDFGEQMLKAIGHLKGTYQVKLHDLETDIYSNALTIEVLGTPETIFLNGVYDIILDYASDNSLVFANQLDNGKVATYKGSSQWFSAMDGVYNGENPELNALTMALKLEISGQGQSLSKDPNFDTYVDIALDDAVNAMTFTYGAAFPAHVDNIHKKGTCKAYIATSEDGVTYADPIDWTAEFEAQISSECLRRKDIRFDNNVKFIRIGFDNTFIGRPCDFYMTSWGFFQEA